MAFFYLEIRIVALAPSLAHEKAKAMMPQDTSDGFAADRFEALPLPQKVLQLAQRPSGEAEAQILRAGSRGLDDHAFELLLIDSGSALASAGLETDEAGHLEPLDPFVGIGVMQIDHLAGLGDAEACC